MCSYTYNQSGFKWYPSVIGRAPADADLVNVEMHLESVSQWVCGCTSIEAMM